MATTTANTTSASASKPRKQAARKRPTSTPKRASAGTSGATRASGRGTTSYAERAVLIPLGAALIARDRVVSSVNELASLSSPSKAQTQLNRFERRGYTARSRFEREVRRTRVRVERELRQRRQEIERKVTNLV